MENEPINEISSNLDKLSNSFNTTSQLMREFNEKIWQSMAIPEEMLRGVGNSSYSEALSRQGNRNMAFGNDLSYIHNCPVINIKEIKKALEPKKKTFWENLEIPEK